MVTLRGVEKRERFYKNFVVKSYNKIEKSKETRVNIWHLHTGKVNVLKILVMAVGADLSMGRYQLDGTTNPGANAHVLVRKQATGKQEIDRQSTTLFRTKRPKR